MVTMGLRSVPFLLFLPPLPLAAEAATLAICFPLFNMALVRSTPSIFVEWEVLRGGPQLRGGAPGCELVGCWKETGRCRQKGFTVDRNGERMETEVWGCGWSEME